MSPSGSSSAAGLPSARSTVSGTAAGPSRCVFVATAPGEWRWKVAATPADDAGLNGGVGALRAVAWSAEEIVENLNRRGFVRASFQQARARLCRWLALLPARRHLARGLDLAAAPPSAAASDVPGPASPSKSRGLAQAPGFNRCLGSSPLSRNWADDAHGATHANKDGVFLRNAGEKFGVWAQRQDLNPDGATTTAK